MQFLINGLVSGAIYVLIALGFTVIYRTVKFFHFAHGAVYATGAYLAYASFTLLAINAPVSFFLSIALTALLGIAINRFAYYPLRKHIAPNLVYLIASFGIFIFIQNLLQLVFGAQILTLRTGAVKEGHHILGAVVTDIQILIIAATLVLFVFSWLF